MTMESRLLEQRLFVIFIVTIVLMGMFANMAQYDGEDTAGAHSSVRWFCCALQIQFTCMLGLLSFITPAQTMRSTVTFLTCITLAIVEAFIASMKLESNRCFGVRVTGYVLISHMELIASTGYKEWSLFGLFVSMGVTFVAWLLLVPVHHHAPSSSGSGGVGDIIFSLLSVGLSSYVWIYLSKVPALYSRSGDKLDQGASYRGFRYDDAVYSLSNHLSESSGNIDPGLDDGESSSLLGGNVSGHGIDVPHHSSSVNNIDMEDQEIMDLRFKELSNLHVHRVCIAVHVIITIVAFIHGRYFINTMDSDLIFGVVINPLIALWQASTTNLSILSS
jgi:hypothetical protein